MADNSRKVPDQKAAETPRSRQTCGVVMPISEMDGYSESHWRQVFELIQEVADGAGFDTRIVSESPEVGVIQRRIVQNLYNDTIVIVDVSGKNPNVMFELGLRLAFDKPTIIIQDDTTKAPFDTGIIEYLEYPKSLHYYDIVSFKSKLSKKISATISKFKEDEGYSTFLKHFGEFRAAEIATKEVSGFEFVSKELKSIRDEMAADRMSRQRNARNHEFFTNVTIKLNEIDDIEREVFLDIFDDNIPSGSTKVELSGEKYNYTLPVTNVAADRAVRSAAVKAGISEKLFADKDGVYEFLPF